MLTTQRTAYSRMKAAQSQHRRKIERMQRDASLFLRGVLQSAGLMHGRTDYTRFIILARSRTGSNLLWGLLDSHPNALVFQELFRNPMHQAGGPAGGHGRRKLRDVVQWNLMQRDPVRFLESRIFMGQSERIAAVGFKIFYYHARSSAWQPVWNYLVGRRDLHVIHVKRANILRTHLSRKRAVLTQNWVDMEGQPAAAPRLTLDYEECLHDFEQTRQWEQEHDQLFANHPLHEVIYEDLAADLQQMTNRVQAFLGLPHLALTPKTHRQSRECLANAIANYAELRARFAGSPWSHFFDE